MTCVYHQPEEAAWILQGHEYAFTPIDDWYRIAKTARWKHLDEVRRDFSSAKAVSNFTVFNIRKFLSYIPRAVFALKVKKIHSWQLICKLAIAFPILNYQITTMNQRGYPSSPSLA